MARNIARNIENRPKPEFPIILKAVQTAPNQILITYDKRVDLESATNVSNYWIRSTNEKPITVGISTEGMDLALIDENALRSDLAVITPADHSALNFLITFRYNAVPGLLHVVLPCYVNVENSNGYAGANWGPISQNMFISGKPL